MVVRPVRVRLPGMPAPLMIVGFVALALALVSGVLGFVVYLASTRRRGRKHPPPVQGLARAMFVIFAAGAFVIFFFGMAMG